MANSITPLATFNGDLAKMERRLACAFEVKEANALRLDLRDLAEAAGKAGHFQVRSRAIEMRHAVEIVIGELLDHMLKTGKRFSGHGSVRSRTCPTLGDLGLHRSQAMVWQDKARYPDHVASFNLRLARAQTEDDIRALIAEATADVQRAASLAYRAVRYQPKFIVRDKVTEVTARHRQTIGAAMRLAARRRGGQLILARAITNHRHIAAWRGVACLSLPAFLHEVEAEADYITTRVLPPLGQTELPQIVMQISEWKKDRKTGTMSRKVFAVEEQVTAIKHSR